jgi:hypothetical protein
MSDRTAPQARRTQLQERCDLVCPICRRCSKLDVGRLLRGSAAMAITASENMHDLLGEKEM